MEPKNLSSWYETQFVESGRIIFSIHKQYADLVPMSDMLAAVVLADSERPWYHNGQAARINVSKPRLTFEDDSVVLHQVCFQSGCILIPNQLSAYVKYTAQLAERARQFMASAEAVNWIGSNVDFVQCSTAKQSFSTQSVPLASDTPHAQA